MTTSSTPQKHQPGNRTGQREELPFSRTLMYLSLGLALLLVAGVLVGSKVVMEKLNNQPVALSELPSPMADSPECTRLVDGLPPALLGHDRAELAQPAPPGAAVWQSSSTERITLRCGVEMPLNYTELTPTFQAGGATWMKAQDPAAGTDLATWFTVDRSPVIAVTADGAALGGQADPVSELDISAVPQAEPEPAPAPLAALEAAEPAGTAVNLAVDCKGLIDASPEEITEGYTRIDISEVNGLDAATAAAWGSEGADPLIMRCGVAPPASYGPGAQLTQINGIAWFAEEASSDEAHPSVSGPGSTVLYALGRTTNIAVALPAGPGDTALATLSELIGQHVPEQ